MKIETALELSEDELYYELGKEIYKQSFFSFPPNKKNLTKIAKDYIKNLKDRLQDNICSNPTIIDYLNAPEKQNKILTISTIIDVIAPFLIEISPVTASVLIFNEGLEAFCKSKDKA